jgi:ectoine hydroxylase-related dioxygenase (phytanoyl-CoA dioxygenase family)
MSSSSCLKTLDGTASVNSIVDVIKRDGGVIISDFVSSDVLSGLQADLNQILNDTPNGEDPYFAGTETRRASRLLARSQYSADVALNPQFLGAAKAILETPSHIWSGSDRVDVTPDVHLSVTQAILIGPGETAQPLHRDDATALWRHPDFGREVRLQVMVAITDFTDENGGTMVRWSNRSVQPS